MPFAWVKNRYVRDAEVLKTSMFMRVHNFSEEAGFTAYFSSERK